MLPIGDHQVRIHYPLDRGEWLARLRRIALLISVTFGVSYVLNGVGLAFGGSKAFGKFPVFAIWPLFIGTGVVMLGWVMRPQDERLAMIGCIAGLLANVARLVGTLYFYFVNHIRFTWSSALILAGSTIPISGGTFLLWWVIVVPVAKGLKDRGTWRT